MIIVILVVAMIAVPFVALMCIVNRQYEDRAKRLQGRVYRYCPAEKKPETKPEPVKEEAVEVKVKEPGPAPMTLQEWLKKNADFLMKYLEKNASAIYGEEEAGDQLFIPNSMMENADRNEILTWLGEQFCVEFVQLDEDGIYAQIVDISLL